MNQGSRITHPVFGLGTILSVERKGEFDNRSYGENGVSHYDRNLNVAVKFDNGGPMGFAAGSSNDANELKELV